MKKTIFLQMLTGVFVGCLLITNITAAKTFTLGSVMLPTAVVIFPLVYIINDVLAEVYGYTEAKRVIWLGFAVNAFAVLAYTIAIALPAPEYATELAAAFETVLGSTSRMLLASFAAYIVGSLINAKVMVLMKKRSENKLMLRCVASTAVGETVDALLFITIAFYGTMPTATLATMVISQAAFKTIYEVISYPVTRLVINKVKSL